MTLSEKLAAEYERDAFESEPAAVMHLRKAIRNKKTMYAISGEGLFIYYVEESDVIIAETTPEPNIAAYTSFEASEYLKVFMKFFNEGKQDDEFPKRAEDIVNFPVPEGILQVRISPGAISYFEEILRREKASSEP